MLPPKVALKSHERKLDTPQSKVDQGLLLIDPGKQASKHTFTLTGESGTTHQNQTTSKQNTHTHTHKESNREKKRRKAKKKESKKERKKERKKGRKEERKKDRKSPCGQSHVSCLLRTLPMARASAPRMRYLHPPIPASVMLSSTCAAVRLACENGLALFPRGYFQHPLGPVTSLDFT